MKKQAVVGGIAAGVQPWEPRLAPLWRVLGAVLENAAAAASGGSNVTWGGGVLLSWGDGTEVVWGS